MKKYLESHCFSSRLAYLSKKLKNKRILIYGTGKMFQEIIKNYDLSCLNIIGITDRKYLIEDMGRKEFGYPIIPFSNWNDVNADVVLLSVQYYLSLQESLKKTFINKSIIPFVAVNYIDWLKYYACKIPLIKKLLRAKNNVVVLVKQNGKRVYNPKIKNLFIKMTGENNYIEIHEPFDITEKVELFGHSDNKIIIGANNQYRRMRVLMGSKNTLQIGRNTTTVSVAIHMFSGCNRIVSIGDDCQFSWDIMIRTTDAHTVYDKDTREIINPAKDVYIGNHVWVAKDVTILKGSCIPSNSVVGVASVVNKEFSEENTIIAGTPAKIVKRNINWDRRGVADFA